MDKDTLAQLLTENHQQFIRQLGQLSDADFCFTPEGKWSAARQLDHIIKSVSPVNMALFMPPWLLKGLLGKANRPSRTYDALVEKYLSKLKEGGQASGRFVPVMVDAYKKEILLKKLAHIVKKLTARLRTLPEASLDNCILPHPLLGKLTLREMLYFTAYHVQHHAQLVEKGLQTIKEA